MARVLVKDNEEVAAGQPLLALDPADFAARLAQTVANEKSAAGMLAQARALLYAIVQKQVSVLSYIDGCWLLGAIMIALVPLVLLLRGSRKGEAPPPAH